MKGKKVLIVPLNWGLGHTTRIIPIIKILIENRAEVTISGSPEQVILLKKEFPGVYVVSLPYLKIRISTSKYQLISNFIQIPKFLLQIRNENKALNQLLRTEAFDLIISDNCYGLWNKKIKSVLITHQLNLILPKTIGFFQPFFNVINIRLVKNFDVCWIPDFEKEPNLSGLLSHPLTKSIHATYIGPLSRFSTDYQQSSIVSDQKVKKKILFLLSGPEPQRTVFETCLVKEVQELNNKYDCIIIRGLPQNDTNNIPSYWINHASSAEMNKMILDADYIICRSGYSTIMDLIALRKSALLIPTPGQSEQEYLAQYLSNKGYFVMQEQNKLNILKGILELEKLNLKYFFPQVENGNTPEKEIIYLLH